MNLAETQNAVKRMLVLIAALTVFYYAGKFIIIQGIGIYRSINPPEAPPPEARFGQIPQLKMQSISVTGSPRYTLDTLNGALPRFPDRLKVYPIRPAEINLLSENDIRRMAEDLEFRSGFTKLTETRLRWIDGATSRTFQADISNKHFTLDTPLSKLSAETSTTPSITESDATTKVRNFINSNNIMSIDDVSNLRFEAVPSQISFGRIQETKPIPTSSKIMKLNVYRDFESGTFDRNGQEIKYKILGPNPKDSLIDFYVTNHNGIYAMPIIDFSYWQVDYLGGSDYGLAPIQSVWNAVQSGSAVVAYANTSDADYYQLPQSIAVDRIDIRDIYLAYYEPKEYTPYLQPIYVFEGVFQTVPPAGETSKSGEIVIYYPAVSGEHVSR